MIHRFILLLETPYRNPVKLEQALQRVIELALESDIEGAEVLDARIKHIDVQVAP